MTALLLAILGLLGEFIASSAAKYIAWKTLITVILLTVLPIVLMNVFYKVMQNAINISNTYSGSHGVSGHVVQLTGLAAFLATNLYLPEMLAVILSALGFRLGLSMLSIVPGLGGWHQ